jgi:predicted peroxiredoxin
MREDAMDRESVEALIVLTSGKQDRGTRATLAFSWACTSLAMGKRTALYLTMDGTMWAHKNAAEGVQVQGFEPLAEYLDQFTSLEGRLMACAPCSEYYCSYNRELMDSILIRGVELVGLSTVVSLIQPTTNVVTF